MTKLGEIAQILRGVTFKPAQLLDRADPDAVICLRTKNVQQSLDVTDLLYVPPSVVKNSRQYLRANDIVVSSANSWNLVGKASWVESVSSPTTFGGFISTIRITSPDVDARYVFRWFTSERVQSIVRSFGQQTTNISNLNVGRTMDLEIPLPPLPEQRRIAEILDRADELRTKRRQTLSMIDLLGTAIYFDHFGRAIKEWPRVALGSIIDPSDRINYGIVQPGENVIGGKPFVRVSDVQAGLVSHEKLKSVSPEIERSHSRSRLRGNELLITCVGTIGNIALVQSQDIGLNIARAVARVPVGPTMIRTFLAEVLKSREVQAQFRKELRTVSQPTLNIKQISETLVIHPPIEKQLSFANAIGQLDGLRTKYCEQGQGLDELFASLQYRAFKGEL